MSTGTKIRDRGATIFPASCGGHTATPFEGLALGDFAGSVSAALDIRGIVGAVSGMVDSTTTRALTRADTMGSGLQHSFEEEMKKRVSKAIMVFSLVKAFV